MDPQHCAKQREFEGEDRTSRLCIYHHKSWQGHIGSLLPTQRKLAPPLHIHSNIPSPKPSISSADTHTQVQKIMIGVLSLMTKGREEQQTEGSDEIVENGKIKNKYGMLRDIQTKTR
jgi:hypothetical protein